MKIICDIDNVLVDWQGAWIRKYEAQYVRVPWATRGRWDCYSAGTHFTSYSEFSTWLGDSFWHHINVRNQLPYAISTLTQLSEHHDITLATHRPPGAPEEAARQLAEHLEIPVVFAAPLEKVELDGDVWIDDAPELLWALKARGKQGVRFVCPWNEGAPGISMECWSEWDDVENRLRP